MSLRKQLCKLSHEEKCNFIANCIRYRGQVSHKKTLYSTQRKDIELCWWCIAHDTQSAQAIWRDDLLMICQLLPDVFNGLIHRQTQKPFAWAIMQITANNLCLLQIHNNTNKTNTVMSLDIQHCYDMIRNKPQPYRALKLVIMIGIVCAIGCAFVIRRK